MKGKTLRICRAGQGIPPEFLPLLFARPEEIRTHPIFTAYWILARIERLADNR